MNFEIEATVGTAITSTTLFYLVSANDLNWGSEGIPTPGDPPYTVFGLGLLLVTNLAALVSLILGDSRMSRKAARRMPVGRSRSALPAASGGAGLVL